MSIGAVPARQDDFAPLESGRSRRNIDVRPRGLGLLLPLRRGGPVARARRESHAADARRSLQEPRGPCFQGLRLCFGSRSSQLIADLSKAAATAEHGARAGSQLGWTWSG